MRLLLLSLCLSFIPEQSKAELQLPTLFPEFAIVGPDCTIIEVSATPDIISIYFDGKVGFSSANAPQSLALIRNAIHIRNRSDEDAGAFTLFSDSVTSLVGKRVGIDIVTTGYAARGSGIYLTFSTSRCRITPLEKK